MSLYAGSRAENYRAIIAAIEREPDRVHVVDLGPYNPEGEPVILQPEDHRSFIELLQRYVDQTHATAAK
jgi:hypothetical protein